MNYLTVIPERIFLRNWLNYSFKVELSTKLSECFVRELPSDPVYLDRFNQEMDLIQKNNFEPIFLQVVNILKYTRGVQHIIRGSAAGSLVSWLLGISNLDPVKHNMSLERFMNHKRLNKPDIDCDFPHDLRDKVFEIVYRLYPNCVGRICNHVMWKRRSALREAFRITKGINNPLVDKIVDNLVGKKHYDSVHCGGVVVFDKPLSKDMILNNRVIKYNKIEAEKAGLVKIDILSNRGLTILNHLDPNRQIHEYPFDDKGIQEVLLKADLIGITYAETPVVMKIVRLIKPKNPIELSLCLALVRPAPDKKEIQKKINDYRMDLCDVNFLVYDDDLLEYIAKCLDTDLAEGELIRKSLAKNEPGAWKKFLDRLSLKYPVQTVNKIAKNLKNIDKYSFCKSHSMNYAYLCWALLWHKVYNKRNFWRVVLSHAHSQYARWVYIRHAMSEGFKVELAKLPKTKVKEWKVDKWYLYCESKQKQKTITSWFKPTAKIDDTNTSLKQLSEYGYWNGKWMKEFGIFPLIKVKNEFLTETPKFEIRGLIACYREYKTYKGIVTFVTLGVDDGHYINLTIEGTVSKDTVYIYSIAKQISKYDYVAEEYVLDG